MKKSVKKNYIFNVVYQIILIILPIITVPYLSRVLGSAGNGVYGYTVAMVSYFIILGSVGVSLYGQREIAYYQNDRKKKSKIFWELFFIKLITTILSMIVFGLIFCIDRYYSFYYRILLLEFVANIIDISWLYQGEENFKSIVFKNGVIKLISIACIFLFIKSPSDVWKYILIYCLSTLVGNASLWINLKRDIDFKGYGKLNFKKHIKPMLILFIPQIAVQVYTILDKSMIGFITHDMSEVGFYDQAQKVVKLLLTVITSMGTVMLPRIASCFSENKHETIKIYMNKTFKFVFLLAFPMIFGIIAVSDSFVPLFFGEGYDKVKILMPILSLIILTIGLSNVVGTQYLLPIKRQKEYTLSIITGAVVNVILNFILIYYYKSIGACVATVMAESTVTLVQMYFVRKDFNIKEIFKYSLKYLVFSIIMFICVYSINFIDLSDKLTIVIQLLLGVTIYGVCLLLSHDEHIEIIKKFLKRK